MKRIEAPCPSCGAPVGFTASVSLATVCEHCQSVVARADRKLEDLGKVAALVETASPLAVGIEGVYRGKSFVLVGRVQYPHASGAVWDEWYAAFPNDRWGWLAEAQGRFMFTVNRRLKDTARLPTLESLRPGAELKLDDGPPFVVNEAGEARLIAARGELPFRPDFSRPHRYADLSGAGQRFATLDYNGPATAVFIGDMTTLDQLKISPVIDDESQLVKVIGALPVACPQCGGALEIKVPEKTERVVCPYCHGESDFEQGNLKYLRQPEMTNARPLIPLGRTGNFRGADQIVIGFMQRSVRVEGREFFWTEYLLHSEKLGFRWLVNDSGHWTYVDQVSPGEVRRGSGSGSVYYAGHSYRLFQRCPATVRCVIGEFFWKVVVGEQAMVSDYIAPPESLSEEIALFSDASAGGSAVEATFSHGVYVPHDEVARAFAVRLAAPGWGVKPNQPNPVDSRIYGLCPVFLAMLWLLNWVIQSLRPAGTVDGAWFWWMILGILGVPLIAFLYQRGFEGNRWQESYIEQGS
jgi:hypothetical protein